MGQGNSANPKQPVQKTDSAEQVEPVESNEDEETSSKLGSLKKGKWLPRKQSEDKPQKEKKKKDKKKKKKDEQEEVSSATCISDADRASLRHSRIELHLEECQPAPDEDDAISLSSCGEDPRKNLKDIESEVPASLIICDYSTSSMTASPGESLSSGQDSGFARGNTIRSVSSEEEQSETNQKNKKITSEISTELITPTVEVTEKCKDYIEKTCQFNSSSPINSTENAIAEEQNEKMTDEAFSTSIVPLPKLETQSSLTETPEILTKTEENTIVEESSLLESNLREENNCNIISTGTIAIPELEMQTSLTETPDVIPKIGESSVIEDESKKADGSLVESKFEQEDSISTTTVSSPKLETQTSLTETPKIESQTEVLKDSDLVSGMVKELVNETLESAVEYLTHEYKKMNNKTEFNEVAQQQTVSEDIKIEETVDKELNLTEITEVTIDSSAEEKSEVIEENSEILSDLPLPPPPSFLEQVSGEGIGILDPAAPNCTENVEVSTPTKEVIISDREVFDSLNKEVRVEDISAETISSTDSLNINNVEIIEKSGDFEELSYDLKVKPACLLESPSAEPDDKLVKDANGNDVIIKKDEIADLPNCDCNSADDSLLSTESVICEDNSMKYEISENMSFSSQLNDKNISDPEVCVETTQNEEIPICPSEILITTDLDADDSGINNSSESLPPFPDVSDISVTENSKSFEAMPTIELSTPEINTINEVQHNSADSSSGSASSPSPIKESKNTREIEEQSSSSTTQPIPDSTTGAVFV